MTIAVLTRSAGVAIGVGIGWLLVVENLIAISTSDLVWLLALGLTILYGTAAASISLTTFRRSDITS